jgi:putative hydrolase of the HAD superfamily
MSSKYSHIFFDLDRTLWDFDRNSAKTLSEILTKYGIDKLIKDADAFISAYHRINLDLWALYRRGEMTKAVLRDLRFKLTLDAFGIDDEDVARRIGDQYLEISPTKTLLIPHSIEILEYLKPRCSLHLITNGFTSTQEKKLKNCNLEGYFSSMTTSEMVGHNKPRPEIFHQALSSVHARKEESIMIGDDLKVDIIGARNYGIDQVFLNRDGISHSEPVTYEIISLLELRDILQ